MRRLLAAAVALTAVAAGSASGAVDVREWSKTPPRGWNSFDRYTAAVNEADVRRNAEAMAKYLKPHGYEYCVIDIRWYTANERLAGDYVEKSSFGKEKADNCLDAWGRLVPPVNRFPSAAGGKGFRPLADYVHSLGLKFGIHVMRGVPRKAVERKLPVLGAKGVTCDMIVRDRVSRCWIDDMQTVEADLAGAQEYYDSICRLYAEWGVDFIKCDNLSAPYCVREVELLHNAILGCGRPIVLSTSPGMTPIANAKHVGEHANMWRITGDMWDRWDSFLRLVENSDLWLKAGPWEGAWPDGDMIPFGTICPEHIMNPELKDVPYGRPMRDRLTPDERASLMNLLAVMRSPFMFGGECGKLGEQPDVLALITDPLRLEAQAKGRAPRFTRRTAEEAVVESDAPGGGRFVAVFNLTAAPRSVAAAGATFELPPHGSRLVRR